MQIYFIYNAKCHLVINYPTLTFSYDGIKLSYIVFILNHTYGHKLCPINYNSKLQSTFRLKDDGKVTFMTLHNKKN